MKKDFNMEVTSAIYNCYQIFRHQLRMSLFNGMGEKGERENLKGRRSKEREGEREEARGSQRETEGRRKMQTQKRDKSLAPLHSIIP